MGRKKKAEVIERVTDAGENLDAEMVDYESMCREVIVNYFLNEHHKGEKIVMNFSMISKEPKNVFVFALIKCRDELGLFPGLKVPANNINGFKYDQLRALAAARVFLRLCLSSDNSPSLHSFSSFQGIDVETLRRWRNAKEGPGALIWDMIVKGDEASISNKLDDSKVPVAQIAKMNWGREDGAFIEKTDNSVKSYAEIAAEMGVVIDAPQIEDKRGV